MDEGIVDGSQHIWKSCDGLENHLRPGYVNATGVAVSTQGICYIFDGSENYFTSH